MSDNKLTIPGKDNYDKPRQDFADKLAAASSDAQYDKIAEQAIWFVRLREQ